MINNRLEEVKKKLKYLHESCMECEYYHGEDCFSQDGLCTRDLDIAKSICQLFPQPLEDAGLREEIAKQIYWSANLSHWNWCNDDTKNYYRGRADQILALLQPKIEEAKGEERERILKSLNILNQKGFSITEALIAMEDSISEQHLKGGE